MRILMLGWEYPPHISGGLGTACEGLTQALSKLGIEILFVVPKLFGGEDTAHMSIVDSSRGSSPKNSKPYFQAEWTKKGKISTLGIPSYLRPYLGAQSFADFVMFLQEVSKNRAASPDLHRLIEELNEGTVSEEQVFDSVNRYSGDIFHEVSLYASNVVEIMTNEAYDLIHAHDWMTYPAAVALSKQYNKKLILHVHSLEFDRSGTEENNKIAEIEKYGLEQADQIIAVSHYTRSVISERYQINPDKISVVHNGVYTRKEIKIHKDSNSLHGKVVLFLGRITFQKGPDYFVEAAAKVIPQVPDVVFVMAGMGDMLGQVKRRVQELGIEEYFRFPGFLRGEEVEQAFSIADLYVMPSVSEPFGISALEAISFETPVIISKQSGVSEVLHHALKVDFWDLEKLSDLIVNALLYPELRQDIVSMAKEEVKRIHWESAASKVFNIYKSFY